MVFPILQFKNLFPENAAVKIIVEDFEGKKLATAAIKKNKSLVSVFLVRLLDHLSSAYMEDQDQEVRMKQSVQRPFIASLKRFDALIKDLYPIFFSKFGNLAFLLLAKL